MVDLDDGIGIPDIAMGELTDMGEPNLMEADFPKGGDLDLPSSPSPQMFHSTLGIVQRGDRVEPLFGESLPLLGERAPGTSGMRGRLIAELGLVDHC